MRMWIILAPDHGRKVDCVWESKEYVSLGDALLEAAWMQQRDWLFGFDNLFTVIEVEV